MVFFSSPGRRVSPALVDRVLNSRLARPSSSSRGQLCAVPSIKATALCAIASFCLRSSHPRASSVVFMSLLDENELLRSHWYLYWGNIAYKQDAHSLGGEIIFMSETENSCSRLCHPVFSRQKIPKSCNQRSFPLLERANNKPKCLSMSTAVFPISSIGTKCPV